ncbi:SpvB/TcaC N-terminal domain-containing protein [Leptospira wolffii]|uniref:SpvB/TcaC N-terminal domain-containing protein n=1 Tax=Leptospira wolffii TaxID=409998 RepID=UPI003CC82E86
MGNILVGRKNSVFLVSALWLLLLSSCTHGSKIFNRVFQSALPLGSSLPSPGAGPAPEGSDLFSISTNYSEAINDPDTKGDPLAGAMFIAPPEPNHFGAVSLSYPIDLPDGRAGVQPSISISYSSSGGDGWVGIGWNLGLGAITRTPEYGALFYDSRDSFSWNGQKLVKVSGSTTNENGVYRPEIAEGDSSLLKLTNIESGGTWEVLDSSGTKTVFGDSSSTRIYDPDRINRTYSWYFSKEEDLNGNYMQAVYDTSDYSENRSLYLKEIRYTGNSKTGANARQYVRFLTKTREDSYVSTVAGFLTRETKLLDTIEVGWDGGRLWEYDLVYDTSFDSGKPILRTVDSNRHTTKPEFEYQTSSRQMVWKNFANQASSEPETNPNSTEYFEGDFNGDGLSDIVFFNPENGNWKAAEGRREGGYNFKLYGNKYKDYKNEKKIRFFKGNVSGDYNGDGRSDIAFYLPETREFVVAEHNGATFQFKSYGKLLSGYPDIFRMEWFPGDYDGNGLSDSVLFDEPTGQWTLMLNKGGSFEFLRFAKKFQNVYRGDYSPNSNFDSVSTTDSSSEGLGKNQVNFLIGDYNGDGRTDVSLYDSRSGKWFVGFNFRNEDKLDPLYFKFQWKLMKTFTAPEQALFGNDRFSGDFNGDGFSDFLLFDRSNGEWILGQTGTDTITFRIWSKTPQYKEITRWLQGDFNGDGATDIGFFSSTDGKFWIGESTSNGFRYKAYSDMINGPNQERVMQTPLPKDEVKITNGSFVFNAASETKTVVLDYQYDGNLNPNRGEKAFTGCFTVTDCSASPEVLLYDRKAGAFHLKKGTTAITKNVLSDFNPEASGINLLFGGRPDEYSQNAKDEILYYQKSGSTHKFRLLKHSGSGTSFVTSDFVNLDASNVINFNPTESAYLVDNFEFTSTKSVLILDEQSDTDTGRFVLVGTSGTVKILVPDQDVTASYLGNLFQNGTSKNRTNRKNYSFFSGNFTTAGGQAQILLVDRSSATHKWYLGTLDIPNSKIKFKLLGGTAVTLPFNASDYDNTTQSGIQYALRTETPNVETSIIFGDSSDSGYMFYRVRVSATSLSLNTYPVTQIGFTNNFDIQGNPIVTSGEETKLYDLSQSKLVVLPSYITSSSIDRPDLIDQVYVFQWIQGDYNGDGITDIGIIHLKEPNWYFAMSTGTVPDVISKVKNGIGGFYEFEYENSTKFDNTGGDGIPDLSNNYRVCTSIVLDNGYGNRIPKSYEYEGGVSFSAFINGKLETDYFGFTKFTNQDAYGTRTVHTYYSQPYSNFADNRALGGAEKETHIIGSDNQDYGSVIYSYEIKHIETVPGVVSYLKNATKVQKTQKGVPTTTSENAVTLDGYNIVKRTQVTTDHYSDTAHASQVTTIVTDFENVASTNQTRTKKVVSLAGTSNEITSNLTYDTRGNLTRNVTGYTGSGLPSVSSKTIEYDYDSYGNRTQERDLSGSPSRGTSYAYDNELHQFVTEKTSFGGSIQFMTRSTIDYGKAFGSPNDTTDSNGNKTYFEYDDFGREIEISADTENGAKTLAVYVYGSSYPLSSKTTLPSGSGDPDFASRSYVDGLARIIYNVKTASDGKYVRSGRVVYNSVGRIVRSSQPEWTDSSEMNSFSLHTTEKNPTSFDYDAIGRIRRNVLPVAEGETSPTIITNTYNDPFEVVTSNSGGTSKRTVKNASGQVLYVEDFGTDGTKAQIGFCYDIAGNLVKKSDLNDGGALSCDTSGIAAKDTSGKNQAYWQYDAFGRLRKNSDPDFGVSSNIYNAFGDLTQSTDARGLVTNLTYDSVGRIMVKSSSDGDTIYNYDGGFGSENPIGKLVRIEDGAQIKTFSYDKLGRVKREIRNLKNLSIALADGPYITEYKYDLLGRVSEIDYPAHPVTNSRLKACYTYGTAGYITGISVQVNTNGIIPGFCTKSIVENIEYNEFGQTSSFGLGNGVQTSYAYDKKQRLVRINSTGEVDGNTKVLQDAVYAFNSQNNITNITNTATDYSTNYNYSYDGLNRLVAADGQYQESADNYTKQFRQSFSYAKNGNLLQKRRHSYSDNSVQDEWNYQYNNHQVTHIDSTQYGSDRIVMGYDASGNMTNQRDNSKDLTKQIQVDSENRIVQVKDSQNTVVGTYWYDEGGFRVRKTALIPKGAGMKNQEILYPSKFYGLEYMDEENLLVSINNIYLNGVRIAALNEEGAIAYFLTDQVDSVSHVLDENAQTLSRIQYEPYGETLVQRGNLDFSPKYNSQELDKETNFYFYNARYYDPQIARFTSADSVIDGEDDTQGWNRFAYVQGNPIAFKDPTGHLINSPGTKAYIPANPNSTPAAKTDPKVNKPQVPTPTKAVPKRLGSNLPKGPPKVPRATPRFSPRGGPRGGGGLAGSLVTFGLFWAAEQYFGPQNYDSNPRLDTLVMQNPDGIPLGSEGKIGFDIPDLSSKSKEDSKGAKGIPGKDLPGKGKDWTKLKGDQGWRDKDGKIWKKDQKHKDHWDISDPNNNNKKIREVDFYGNELWPNGPKNKGKK